MKRRDFLKTSALGAAALATPHIAKAQTVTLRMHSFLPPASVLASEIMKPFADDVRAATDGAIEIQQFDSMALGGRPPELIDQARDGVADIILTLPGYTPGRFPRTEVFELPFMMTSPVATARAFQQMQEEEFQGTEYSDYKMIASWVHGPGIIHSVDPVTKLEDMRGKTLRGPTRIINTLLSELGAEPVGMPVPAVPEALSKGVINGTVIPWEVSKTLRISELVSNHTEFAGPEAFYTATFVLAMNKASYDRIPEELRPLFDAQGGVEKAADAAARMEKFDGPARQIALDAGSTIHTLDEAEVARWKEAAAPVFDGWVEDMNKRDIDGQALIDRARELISANA